MKGYEALEVM